MDRYEQRLLQVLQQSLSQPQLSYSDLPRFRQQLCSGLHAYSTLYNAVFLAAQAQTPGMAFLAAYQNTIRCLDADCPKDQLAAFCVSEKGVKKPWDMKTQLVEAKPHSLLTGQKGYVMLLPDELDRLYVIAKDDVGQLKCVFLSTNQEGISITEGLNAPFVEDIPHSGIRFEKVVIAETQVMKLDGHREANRPFRYWEDVHISLAMLAWMLRECIEQGKKLAELDNLTEQICQIIEKFEQQPDYYSSDIFSLLDQSHELLDEQCKSLSQASQRLWKKDRVLLQMGQKIRHFIQAKLAQ